VTAAAAGERHPPLFFFVHLQKTAGTALFRRLRHQFGDDAVYPTPQYQGDLEATLDVDLLLERVATHRQQIRVVTGHFPFCVAELLDASVTTFTLLREPVERTLSFLRHQAEVEPRFAGVELDRIYEDPICRDVLVRNHMVRMLSLTADEMTQGALTPVAFDADRLEQARENLEGRIDVMGIQEEFDLFCTDLETRFGWDLGPSQFANRTQPKGVPDGLRDRIAEDNGLDLELYDIAVGLWRQRHPGGAPSPKGPAEGPR